ncbi:hypothetical protein BDM02DRAFT_2897303 [Thelephora ganbajun]|uniref:Uncharacterized protein n=1 Tax=Thelephora ganbajun TaxID=370292 RepID=A0ACB6ZB86_THEGA|nr:hypothetical protein BDM02DRAFT_2897303 [Thelephora ganbajun]
MSRTTTRSVRDLASLPSRTLQAALKASEEQEAKQHRGGPNRKRKLAEKYALEVELKQVKEELGDETTDGDESEYDKSEEKRPTKRLRKSTTVQAASTSSGSNKKEPRVMSKRDSCTRCRSREITCIWDGIGTRCTACKKTSCGCDRWVGNDAKSVESKRTQGDLEKFAVNLERRLGRMEKIVDRIGQEFFGPL